MRAFYRPFPHCGHCGALLAQSNFEHIEKSLEKGYFVLECLTKVCEAFHQQQRLVIEHMELEPHIAPQSAPITPE